MPCFLKSASVWSRKRAFSASSLPGWGGVGAHLEDATGLSLLRARDTSRRDERRQRQDRAFHGSLLFSRECGAIIGRAADERARATETAALLDDPRLPPRGLLHARPTARAARRRSSSRCATCADGARASSTPARRCSPCRARLRRARRPRRALAPQHSPLGRELDSLADVISFGVAPGGAGLRARACAAAGTRSCCSTSSCCGVSRLARYNVTAEALSAETRQGEVLRGHADPDQRAAGRCVLGARRVAGPHRATRCSAAS